MKRTGLAVMSGIVALTVSACSGETESKGEISKTNSGKTVVTVSVRQSDRFIQLAEQLYEQAHPDIDIQIKEYVAAPDGGDSQMGIAMDAAAFEKYVQAIGTEILSGKGSDLIAMQDLPISKYAEKKVLADLNELIVNDTSFQLDSYYNNIINSTKTNNGLYAMPLSFSLHLMLGDAGALQAAGIQVDDASWTWETFSGIATQLVKDENGDGIPDKYMITNMTPESMLVNLLKDNYGAFVDSEKRQAYFETASFHSLLEQIKDMYDARLLSAENASWGEQYFVPWSANSPESLALYPKSVYDGKGEPYRKPGTGGGIAFSSGIMLGINAKSNVKREAWDFLAFLLSEDMQSSSELKGIPLHKSVVENELNRIQQNLKDGKTKLISGHVPQPFTDEALQRLKTFMEDAGTFTQTDSKVISIIMEEAKSYYVGQKSAQEVASLIQNRVTTYLNE